MIFLRLFERELAATWRQFLLLAALSGVANAAVLATINQAAASPSDSDSTANVIIVLALAILLYSLSQKALMLKAANLAENTVDNMRVHFVRSLQSADLVDIEELNKNEFYNCISGEMQVLSDGALGLIVIGQSLVLVVVTMVYLAWLSFPALAVASLFVVIAASFHLARNKQITDQLEYSSQLAIRLLGSFTDYIEGCKEVKLSRARSFDLADRIRTLSAQVTQRRLITHQLFTTDFVASQVAFFLLVGIMVFVVPLMSGTDRPTIIKITATVLFLIGPISAAVGGVPVLQRVNAASQTIMALEAKVKQIGGLPLPGGAPDLSGFQRIALSSVTFRYPGASQEGGFEVGPIDLEIQRGQIVFITGGNGSGKSTLLKLITSLYWPIEGELVLDAAPISPENAVNYRDLISAIFSDNHLFQEFYGIRDIDPKKAQDYLALLEMDGKVQVTSNGFDTISMSSGQRKRLAMIALLLEDRPICVFDEWAADQDPHFRQKFYLEIIPRLKRAGKTVIAVTHDEKYFDKADMRLHLEEGRLWPSEAQSPVNGA